jgi:hypothetical protein
MQYTIYISEGRPRLPTASFVPMSRAHTHSPSPSIRFRQRFPSFFESARTLPGFRRDRPLQVQDPHTFILRQVFRSRLHSTIPSPASTSRTHGRPSAPPRFLLRLPILPFSFTLRKPTVHASYTLTSSKTGSLTSMPSMVVRRWTRSHTSSRLPIATLLFSWSVPSVHKSTPTSSHMIADCATLSRMPTSSAYAPEVRSTRVNFPHHWSRLLVVTPVRPSTGRPESDPVKHPDATSVPGTPVTDAVEDVPVESREAAAGVNQRGHLYRARFRARHGVLARCMLTF